MNKSFTLPPLYYYVARLIRMYPFTQSIMAYLNRWSEELKRTQNDHFLCELLVRHWLTKKGHDRLILKDLQELKIPIQRALNQFPSDSVKYCIASFNQSVAIDPLHFLAWPILRRKAGCHDCNRTGTTRLSRNARPIP